MNPNDPNDDPLVECLEPGGFGPDGFPCEVSLVLRPLSIARKNHLTILTELVPNE